MLRRDKLGPDSLDPAFDLAHPPKRIVHGLGMGLEFATVDSRLQPIVVRVGEGDSLARHGAISNRSFLIPLYTKNDLACHRNKFLAARRPGRHNHQPSAFLDGNLFGEGQAIKPLPFLCRLHGGNHLVPFAWPDCRVLGDLDVCGDLPGLDQGGVFFPPVQERMTDSGEFLDPFGFGLQGFRFGLDHFKDHEFRRDLGAVFSSQPVLQAPWFGFVLSQPGRSQVLGLPPVEVIGLADIDAKAGTRIDNRISRVNNALQIT